MLHNDGCFIACFKVDAFRDLSTFRREVTEFAAYLKDTPTAEGVEEIFYPGEIEHRRTQERLRDGIAVEDRTWEALQDLARRFGVQAT